MAKVFIEETTLTAIGDAIRGKTGKTELIDPANMSTEIASIEAGGGGGAEIPEEAFILTGDIPQMFSGANWDWFLKDYGDRISTKDITVATYAFANTKVTEIPFTINLKAGNIDNLQYMFQYAAKLTVCPKIRGENLTLGTTSNIESIFNGCSMLQSLEDAFEPEALQTYENFKVTSAYSVPKVSKMFQAMTRLQTVPTWFYSLRLNPESTSYPYASYALYNYAFNGCYNLKEILNIPVWHCNAAQTSNMFSYTFTQAASARGITFETQSDGSPIKTQWKSQVIELNNSTGFGGNISSAIFPDKGVSDDASYQALKNDPDWWASSSAYSTYNHDSAVETINSLPDTSEYLTATGGTNTIKFKKNAGSKTDGGAIENLTDAEIAVAAAKGWTVTLA